MFQNTKAKGNFKKSFQSDTFTDLRVEKELEWPAMREVVLRRPRAGGMATSSFEVRGTELALVDTDSSRSGWSSLRLRRRRLFLCSLKLRPLNRLIKLWETISSKRCLCFLGMKILTNMAHTQQMESQRRNCSGVWTHSHAYWDKHWIETHRQRLRRRDSYEKVCYNYTGLRRCLWPAMKEKRGLVWCNEALFFCSVKRGR